MSCNNSSLARQNKSRGSPNAPQNLNQDSSIFSSNPCENHDWDIVSLCLCSLANAFVLINVFPYSGFMVLFLLPRTTPETTGTYAGFLASSFMLGRCVTAVEWGKIADKYGRVCALQASLVLSAVFCILFGTSQSYYMAIVWRFCLGMVNSITSTTKTLASEIGHGSEDKERRAMGLVIGMRSWGFLIGPAIGGALAEPLSQYPNVSWLQRDGWWHIVLEKFPFLLPNLVVAICCLGGAASAAWFIEETLSAKRDWTMRHYLDEAAGDLATCWEQCSQRLAGCCRRPGVSNGDSESQTLLQKDSANIQYGQATISNEPNASASSEKLSIWSRIATRQLLIVNWLFSFVVTFIDEAFPLFCISNVGGLGLSEASIAKILSLAGLVFAALQYIVYVTITDRVGLYSSIEIGCFLGLVPAGLIPLSVWFWRRSGYDTTFNDSQLEGPHLSLLILFYLGILLGFCKIMTCMCFASLSIATNKTVPPCQRAEMNGLCVVGSSIAKGAAPIFGGALVSFSFSSSLAVVPHEYGSVVIFSTIALLGFWVTCRTLRLDRSFNVII